MERARGTRRQVAWGAVLAVVLAVGPAIVWGHGNHCKPPRPHGFCAHAVGLMSAGGFAVNGCFPTVCTTDTYGKGNNGLGNGLDPQPPGDPKPNDTPDRAHSGGGDRGSGGQDGPAGHCGAGEINHFGVGVRYIEHPPLTPEERRELKRHDRRCSCHMPMHSGFDWKHYLRHQGLKGKKRNFDHERRKVHVGVNVGEKHYLAESWKLVVDCAAAGNPRELLVFDHTQDVRLLPRPWHFRGLRPVAFKARIREACPRGGAQGGSRGTVELWFTPHQGRLTAFGGVHLEDKPVPLSVMAQTWHCFGRPGRPAWHTWCKPGREDDGEWEDDDPSKDDEEDKDHDMGKDREKGSDKANGGGTGKDKGGDKANGGGTGKDNGGDKANGGGTGKDNGGDKANGGGTGKDKGGDKANGGGTGRDKGGDKTIGGGKPKPKPSPRPRPRPRR